MTNAIDEIKRSGDAVEQLLFSDDQFAADFSVYAEIWARFVKPNRRTGSVTSAVDEWSLFAENHYSAIVRCWGVRQAKGRAEDFCLQLIQHQRADMLIETHHSLALYFMLAGGAIENLERCFGMKTWKATPPDRGSVAEPGTLGWFYERRTKAIHKIVVPLGVAGGLPVFDDALWGTASSWHKDATGKSTPVSSLLEDSWPKFVQSMNAWWSQLLTRMKAQAGTGLSPTQSDPVAGGGERFLGSMIPASGTKPT